MSPRLHKVRSADLRALFWVDEPTWRNSCPISTGTPIFGEFGSPILQPARLASRKPLRSVGSSKDVVLLDVHVTKVDADAEPDAPLLGHFGFAVGYPALDLHGATHSIHNADKFHQKAVPSILCIPAPVLRDLWVNQLREVGLAGDIGGENLPRGGGSGPSLRYPSLAQTLENTVGDLTDKRGGITHPGQRNIGSQS